MYIGKNLPEIRKKFFQNTIKKDEMSSAPAFQPLVRSFYRQGCGVPRPKMNLSEMLSDMQRSAESYVSAHRNNYRVWCR